MTQNTPINSSEPRLTGLLVALAGLFVTFLITSNIIAVKLIAIDPPLPGFLGDQRILPAAIVVFPITYILGDVLTEVYGFQYARRVIWLGFLCNLVAVLAFWIGGLLPAAVFWQDQGAYETILGSTPRLLTASFIAYLVGEFSNSMVLAWLKGVTQGRFLWLRTISSTVVGQGFDSFVFIFIAFGLSGVLGAEQLFRIALIQWWAKIAYEALATPLTYWVVNYLKRREQLDVYDTPRSLNPLAVFA